MILKNKSMSLRFVSSLLSAFLVLQTAVPIVSAAEKTAPDDQGNTPELTVESADESSLMYEPQITYSSYYDQYKDDIRPEAEVVVRGSDFRSKSAPDESGISLGSCGAEYGQENRDDVLIWDCPDGEVTYEVTIPESGTYCVGFSYLPIPSNMANIEFSILIDGESPYDTATRATLNKVYVNDGEITYDSRGNQVRPSQKQTGRWMDSPLLDVDGLFNDPLLFHLDKGTHDVTFQITKGYFALDEFKFYNPEELPDYADYKASAGQGTASGTLIRIEGEAADYKSDSTLYPTNDNSSYLASPSNPAKTMYNTIGSGNWNQAMQTITWTIPGEELKSDGWYKLGIKARQNEMRGFYSNRRIYIDGQVPCKELDQVRFYYDTDWQSVTTTGENGDELMVYLTGGEDHTLTMEVIPGEIGESMRVLDAAVLDINTYYRKILMITGPSPDQYTDYYVHEKIPDLLENFERLSADLKRIKNDIETLAGSEGSEAAALERMYLVLDSCVERPLRIPDYLSQIKENITALSAWMIDYRGQPLEVDYIEVASPDMDFSPVKENVFRQAGYSWQRFTSSFFEDYTNLSDETGEDAVNVWVSLGRDQALVVKSLVDSEFAQEYDTNISVNLVVGGVVEATLAGKGPDVALFLGGEFPVNLAARGLLTDLSQFPDYQEVAGRFQQYATVPYQYDNGVYGLPLTQSWAMMFYRKDVLSELGYNEVPQTWDDIIDMLPALQRNYMYMGLVLPAITGISAATESGHTFAALMLQNGMNYYNDAQTKTNFDDIVAVKAFEQWTDLYTKYGFEQTYDGFNRFRTGEYPIVIADYSFYNQLTVASPEIRGLWDFAQIPGTMQADGSVSHAVNSTSSGAVIFNQCKDIDGAWDFLKWFTSTEVQVEYGTQIEGLLGQLGRYTPANREAITQLSWSKSEQQTLLTAQDELVEIPIIPASYAVTRNIMNAFRETVNNNENPRDTLLWYNRDINTEINRKRENLGLSAE
ncbi:MAG: extracellular solute-binding protein [Oscillospiraceae bacterium]|nr:extracellular solute-binding protein [Oscillospiraceae bacterium]